MKTSIKKLVLLFIVSVVMGVSTLAVAASPVTLLEMKNIKRIDVSGNVELILVQGNKESIKVYDEYYPKNALIQQENGVLRISSYDKKVLSVVVTAAQLQEVSASGTASITTFGKINYLSLDINLAGRSTANVTVDVINLGTKITDQAKLVLNGSSQDFYGVMASHASLNLDKFSSKSSRIKADDKLYYAFNKTRNMTLYDALNILEN